MEWSIANLGASTRKMSYSIDICACENVGGAIETLVSSSYTDDSASPGAYPSMPESIPVELSDSSYICGLPSVELGERPGHSVYWEERSFFLTINIYAVECCQVYQ